MPFYVNEASACTVRVRFFNDTGDLVTPASARYLIRDLSNQRVVRDWTSFDPTDVTDLQITADENNVYDTAASRRFEKRVVTVQADTGQASQKTNEIEYWIRNLYGLVNES